MNTPDKTYVASLYSAVEYLKKNFSDISTPKIAIETGSSGPHKLLDYMDNVREIGLPEDLFPLPKIHGHLPVIRLGYIRGVLVVWVPGRNHFNEHGNASLTVFMVRVLALWGCEKFIITNLSGTIKPDTHPVGSVVSINGHIPCEPCNPLAGDPDIMKEIAGPKSVRHHGMNDSYSERLIEMAMDLSLENSEIYPPLLRGVYRMLVGPHFENEYQKLDSLKTSVVDLFGMSTVPQVEALTHMRTGRPGIEILALSVVSNIVAGDDLSHESNLHALTSIEGRFARLIADLIPRINGLPG